MNQGSNLGNERGERRTGSHARRARQEQGVAGDHRIGGRRQECRIRSGFGVRAAGYQVVQPVLKSTPLALSLDFAATDTENTLGFTTP